MSNNQNIKGIEDYQYGFADKDTSIYKTKQGLTLETVLEISLLIIGSFKESI